MTTNEVAEKCGVAFGTASHWATANGLGRRQVKGVLAFDWTDDDVARFAARRKSVGRPRKS